MCVKRKGIYNDSFFCLLMRSAPVSHDTRAIMKNLSVKKHEINLLAFLTVFIVTIKYE